MTKTTFHPPGWDQAPGYSHAVLTSGARLLFISGQVAFDEHGGIVGVGDFETQVTRAFENLRAVLEAAGSSFEKVVRLGYFVVDLDGAKLQTIRGIRRSYLPGGDPPASTLIGVARLVRPELLIEIEAVAET